MPNTPSSSGQFRTNKLANIYSSGNGGKTVSMIGTMDSGVQVGIRKTITSGDGTTYCEISGSPASSYANRNSGAYTSAAGKFIRKNDLVEVTSNGTATIQATTISGQVRKLTNIRAISPEMYTVKTNSYCQARTGPGNDFPNVRTYVGSETLTVCAVYVDAFNTTWGAISKGYDRWIYFKTPDKRVVSALRSVNSVAPAERVAHNPYTTVKDTANGVIDASADTYASVDAINAILDQPSTLPMNSSDAAFGLHNMQYVIGIPPKITPTADIRYMQDGSYSNNFGRCYTELFMMENTLFSIQPCKVKYLPGFNADERDNFFNRVASAVGPGDDAGIANELSGQLFEGQPDYNEYINTVNLLARSFAIYLGIGNREYMNSGKSYKSMDYSFYKTRNKRVSGSGHGVFGVVANAARSVVDSVLQSVINDDTYLHFYMTADGTSVDDSMSVSTRQSGLEALFNNNLSELAQEIQFLGGGSSGMTFDSAVKDAEAGNTSMMGTTISNIVKYGGNYLKGGRLVFPQMVDDCTYDRSYRGSCRFISPSGDPEAIFLNCYLPLCYLLPYVLPQMMSDNMYRYPFLARVNAKGLFHCDLAAITGLQIQRGGADGTAWTADGLPFEIDVSFNVTPLYSKLMVTSSRHPVLFLSNSALHEYLGAMCGISFTGADATKLKLQVMGVMTGNAITGVVPSMLRGYYSSGIANWLRKAFTFS